jgi:hypothetical protein
MILEYLKWVLMRNYNIGCRLFSQVSDSVLDPHQMLNFFQEFENQTLSQILKEKYLEALVIERKVSDETLHTKLALFYIDMLFKFKPPEVGPELNPNDANFSKINSYSVKLRDFLRLPSANYNAESCLEKIKNSWLFHDEIYLYGKTKKHDAALRKLVKSKEFLFAEQYCADRQDNLLIKLFDIYMSLYNDVKRALKDNPKDEKKNQFLDFMTKTIHDFLRKYATHPQLDPIAALEKLPEDWILSEEGNSLYSFLSAVISSSLNKKRNTKAARHISEMDLLIADSNLVGARKACVNIGHETKCAVCQRRIADKVFAVFPNGIIIHSTCGSSQGGKMNVCPVTGQNFERTFKN